MHDIDVFVKGDFMVHLSIFFDESGKNRDKPHLMGALSIPDNVYYLPEIENLKPIIEKKDIHWAKYSGDSNKRTAINKIIKTIIKHQAFIKLNIINYDQSVIERKANDFRDVDRTLSESTIYMKLPERIIYGLLRHYGNLSRINARIMIEEATEYKKPNVNLKEQLIKQLNIQAIYRAENFKVTSSHYVPKKAEVGLETTDLILGMVRTILKNPEPISRKNKRKYI